MFCFEKEEEDGIKTGEQSGENRAWKDVEWRNLMEEEALNNNKVFSVSSIHLDT
jgi:hypothetical protein